MSTQQLAEVTDRDRHCRENFWGDETETDEQSGHSEVEGTDAAEHIAFNHLRELLQPVCRRTLEEEPWNGGRMAELFAWLCDGEHIDGRGHQLHKRQELVELTEPAFHLPKQIERNGRYIEYRQFRHRRRYNPETGYINWGESTGTTVPEASYEIFKLAFANYLCERHGRNKLREYRVQDYVEMARRHWTNPQMNSLQSLTKAIAYVRDQEPGPD